MYPNTKTVSVFEAKTKFADLLEKVCQGTEITITQNKKPVAKLVPFKKSNRMNLTTLFQQMKDFGATHPLNPKGRVKISYRELIDGDCK